MNFLLPFLMFLSTVDGLPIPSQTIDYPDWDNSVRFLLVSSQEPVRPGDELELAVLADIVPGYHLYGPEEKRPSRTEIVFVETQGIQTGAPAFPPVIRRDLAGLGEFDLYEGEIAVRIPVTVEDSLSEGSEVHARIRVKYQVCTDSACSSPTSMDMEIRIPLAEPGSPVHRHHEDIFNKPR